MTAFYRTMSGIGGAEERSEMMQSPESISPPNSLSSTTSLNLNFPLPIELFVLSLNYLNYKELTNLLTISKNWNSFLISESSFWTKLDWLKLNLDQTLQLQAFCRRNSLKSNRRVAGIDYLRIKLDQSPIQTRESSLSQRTTDLFSILDEHCVDSYGFGSLKHLNLQIINDSAQAFGLLTHLALFMRTPTFVQLEQLNLVTILSNFTIGSDFFKIWSNLRYLKIIAHVSKQDPVQHDWFQLKPYRVEAYRDIVPGGTLEIIDLSGVLIRAELRYFPFPALTRIILTDCTWEGKGLFFLLRICRKTLLHLELNDFSMIEVDGEEREDWERQVMTKDRRLVDDFIFEDYDEEFEEYERPAPIEFSVLRELILTGEDTPPIFNSLEMMENIHSTFPVPTPIFVMPRLEVLIFRNLSCDLETTDEVGEGGLATLGRNCGDLKSLTFHECLISDETLFELLAGINGKLLKLDLINTAITDKLIIKLPDLTRQLRSINVTGSTDISTQGMARMVEIFHTDSNQLSSVRIDRPNPFYERETRAYNWLDFIGILRKPEWDYTGLGPNRYINYGQTFKNWIKLGKLNEEKELQKIRASNEFNRQIKEAEHAQQLTKTFGFQQGSSSGSVSTASSSNLQNRSISIDRSTSNTSNTSTISYESQIPTFTTFIFNQNPVLETKIEQVVEEDIEAEGAGDEIEMEEEPQYRVLRRRSC